MKKEEILYNLINSLIAGSLVFVGSLSTGTITWQGVGLAGAASLVVALTKFQTFWASIGRKGNVKIFNFVGGING